MTATTATAPAGSAGARPLTSRVSPLDGLKQSATLAWRTVVQVRHNPWELSDFSIQPIMFVLLFTFVFGGAIQGDWRAYLEFVVPGMFVMNMLFVTMYVAQGLNTDLTKGVFDRLRSLPIARWSPLAGRIAADQVKQIWSIFLVALTGVVLGFRPDAGWLGLLWATLLLLGFALAFSWVSVLIGLTAKDPERVQIFGFTFLFPITFVSNVFVPAESIQIGWLRWFIEHNPVSVLSDAVRGMIHGGPVMTPTITSLIWAAVITLIFAPLSVRTFKRKV
ncbi:MAG TPA: ABC transporter permease [Natronosporangium sp.]